MKAMTLLASAIRDVTAGDYRSLRMVSCMKKSAGSVAGLFSRRHIHDRYALHESLCKEASA
jgi:hypothetical protein